MTYDQQVIQEAIATIEFMEYQLEVRWKESGARQMFLEFKEQFLKECV